MVENKNSQCFRNRGSESREGGAGVQAWGARGMFKMKILQLPLGLFPSDILPQGYSKVTGKLPRNEVT